MTAVIPTVETHTDTNTTCSACGTAMHASVISAGFDRHAGCEPDEETRDYQWGCIDCDLTGWAANPTMAIAFLGSHRRYACPATAPSYDHPIEGYLVRMARRAALHAAYPDLVPAYTRPWHARTNRNTR